jgi:radical SAM protein with 4Fe4S-binding SPASM domain
MTMPKAAINPNFQSLAGSCLDRRDERFLAYRRAFAENPRTFTVGDFPVHLDVEVTSRCNLRCTFCNRRTEAVLTSQEDMPLELYRTILAEAAARGLAGLKLSYRGEPLLHPDIVDMVGLAKAHGLVDVFFNTNGMLLDRDLARALMEAGLDRVSVSMEGTDPARFEANRRGADFGRIRDNIEGFLELRRSLGRDRPTIRVQTVRLPWVDLEEYRRFWSPRCDEVAVVELTGLPAPGRPAPDWACPQPWQRLTIDSAGQVLQCNNCDYRAAPLGLVGQDTIAAIWRHPLLMEARSLHERGLSHLARACADCPWRNAMLAKERPTP